MPERQRSLVVFVLLVASALLLTGCRNVEDDRLAREAKHDIACNMPYNDSGNVCVLKVGDRDCVAILPDDESGNSLADEKQLIECPEATR